MEQEKRIITLEKEIEDAKKAIREAQPKPTATPLEGKAELKQVTIEPEIRSYQAMAKVSRVVACEIYKAAPDARNIAIYNAKDFNDWRNYKLLWPTLQVQLDQMDATYKSILDVQSDVPDEMRGLDVSAATSVIGAASTLLRSFVDLVSIFRTDTVIEGVAVTVDDNALTAKTLQELKNVYANPTVAGPAQCSDKTLRSATANSFRLFIPGMFMPVTDASGSFNSTILEKLKQVYINKAKADELVARFDDQLVKIKDAKTAAKEAKDQLDQLTNTIENSKRLIRTLPVKIDRTADPDKKEELEKALEKAHQDLQKAQTALPGATEDAKLKKAAADAEAARITPALELKIARLRRLNTQFDKFLGDFTKLDDKTGMSGLALFVKSENLDKVLADPNTFWLQLKAVKAGGNNRTRRNLIRYIIGPDISHSGGVIVEYILSDKSGAIRASNADPRYLKYVNAGRLQEQGDGDN